MARAVLDADGFKFTQQFFLPLCQFNWRLDHNMAVQVAMGIGTHTLDALAAQAEDFARLGFSRNFYACGSIQGGDFNFTAQCGSGKADRHFAMQIIAITLEHAVRFDVYFHI